ncbi:MAG TPA: hypothetical protein VH087_16205 [Thermoanaerobaculia bacterium]|jgi:hypothetical protein|nr:hypothetical protein [Thermoanaerobaculia bacterium]
MFSALLLFALTASTTSAHRLCPPAGFEHVEYASEQVAETLAAELQHRLGLFGDHGWDGPAGMEGRPASVDLDLYLQPNGEVAAACVVSGEHHVVAEVARDLALLRLNAPHERLIVPLNIQLVWRSGRAGQDLTEVSMYALKVSAAERP